MKHLIFGTIVGLSLIAFTGCTDNAEVGAKCQSGKCQANKCQGDKAKSMKCSGDKTKAKCQSGKCGN